MLRAEGGGGKIKGQKAEVMEGRPVHCWSGRSQSGWFRGYLGAGQGFHCSIRIWPASSLTFISFHPPPHSACSGLTGVLTVPGTHEAFLPFPCPVPSIWNFTPPPPPQGSLLQTSAQWSPDQRGHQEGLRSKAAASPSPSFLAPLHHRTLSHILISPRTCHHLLPIALLEARACVWVGPGCIADACLVPSTCAE